MFARLSLFVAGLLFTFTVAEAQSLLNAAPIDVTLSDFRFEPDEIDLIHGRSYALHFVNASGGGHDFVAKKFFAAAAMTADERQRIARGEVELDGHEQATVMLTAPDPGLYEFHCGHFMHATLGMKGLIRVR